jgi:hypothetical protein
VVSRRAQHLAELIDLKVCESRSDFEAAHSLSLSLEQVLEEDHDLHTWTKYQDLAARTQRQRDEFRKAIGDREPFPGLPGVPSKGALDRIAQYDDGTTGLRQRRTARPPGTQKRVVPGHGKPSPDAVAAHQEKKSGGES